MFSLNNATNSLTPAPPSVKATRGISANRRSIRLGANERIAQLIQNQLFKGKQKLHLRLPAAKGDTMS
jgi:hypothetical protein